MPRNCANNSMPSLPGNPNDVLSELVHRRSFAFKAMGDALVAQMRDEFERFYELTGHGALEPIALFFRCSAVA